MTEEEKLLERQQQKEENKEKRKKELEKIASLHGRAKLQYLWDYYKIVIVIIIAAIAVIHLATTMIRGLMTDVVLSVDAISADYFGTSDQVDKDFTAYIGGLKKNQEIRFDLSIDIEPDETSQLASAANIKLQTAVSAGTMDVVLVPDDVFLYLQKRGLLMDLGQVLSEDEVDGYLPAGDLAFAKDPDITALSEQDTTEDRTMDPDVENSISMIMAMNEAMNQTEGTESQGAFETAGDGSREPLSVPEDPKPEPQIVTEPSDGLNIYGIRVDDSDVLSRYGWYPDGQKVYFGIVGNSENTEMAHTFLNFLKGVDQS